MTDWMRSFEHAGFEVNWCTVLVGWLGPGRLGSQVTLASLKSYADTWLTAPQGSRSPDAVYLASLIASASPLELTEVSDWLRGLADCVPGDEAFFREERKWRAALLFDRLRHLPRDPIEGQTALATFWAGFGFPEDSPFKVQASASTPCPRDYYDEPYFQRHVEAHRAWLQQEIEGLRAPV